MNCYRVLPSAWLLQLPVLIEDNSFDKSGSLFRGDVPLMEAEKEKPGVAPPVGGFDVTGRSRAPQGVKSKRIFVARIPTSVSEAELRKHFEAYGAVEDAYRPRDFSKNTFRGIGFVTFADPAAVDRVMAMKHTLGGTEVIVDRATPKEKSASSSRTESATELPSQNKQVDCGDETVRAFPSAEAMANNYPTTVLLRALNEQAFDLNFISGISTTATYPNSTGNNCGPPSNISDDCMNDPAGLLSGGDGSDVIGTPATVSTAPASLHVMNSAAMATVDAKTPATATVTVDAAVKLPRGTSFSPRHQSLSVPSVQNERSPKTLTDNFAHVRKVRGGPRIFVGKISKSTVEQDLADYFSQFGFVVDVYIPRSRENKKEHRGFGFVTFETEASIKRTISQGTHTLKGSVLAIDVAVPENSPTN